MVPPKQEPEKLEDIKKHRSFIGGFESAKKRLTEYNTKKIVLNNVNDLMNIPIQQLRTAQLKNFCGTLFDQLYQEAMTIEHNQVLKTQNNKPPNNEKNPDNQNKINKTQ